MYVLFTEVEEGGLKASMRSTAAIDVSKLAAQTYGGGGHARASGLRIRSFDNFQLQVLECVQKLKEGMRAQHEEEQNLPAEAKLPLMPAKPVAVPSAPAKPASQPVPPPQERDIVQDLTNGKK